MSPTFLNRISQAFQKKKATPPGSGAADTHQGGRIPGVGSLVNGRFRLESEIGRGGMGIVYRARDLQQDREAAVKVILPDRVNELSLGQFSREAQITLKLNHPHIVAVYEVGNVEISKNELAPYIAMEYVAGTSLEEFHELTYARIIDLGKQICDALSYAHNQGFIHRDLKPANVLISRHGFQLDAKLVDFGLAIPRGFRELPPGNNMAGTIYYLAPEVIAGGTPDVPSDLYALGAMLYEMVTGRVPFSDFIDEEAILNQHLSEQVTPPHHARSDIPPDLDAIILRLLSKSPQERFPSAEQVARALERVALPNQSSGSTNNLPPILTDLSAFENEIQAAERLLENHRLVTLPINPPNLAVAVATRLLPQFKDGVLLVDLTQTEDPALVLPKVAATLGIKESPQRALLVSLVENLREKSMLLLFEPRDLLISACIQVVTNILKTCPEVRILVVSPHSLNLSAEESFPVASWPDFFAD